MLSPGLFQQYVHVLLNTNHPLTLLFCVYNSIAWMWRPVEGLGLSPASATYFLCKLGHLMNLSVTLLIH